MGMMSPGDSRTSSRRLICACARIARVSSSASCSAAVSAGAHASWLSSVVWPPSAASASRTGASRTSGSSQSMWPLRAPNSTVNLTTRSASSGAPSCTSRGLVSCFTSSNSSGVTGAQAAVKSAAKLRSISARKRCAAGAMAACGSTVARPDPPKKPSSKVSRRSGSTLTKAKPGSGLSRTTARLAGTGSAACKSALFADSNEVNCMAASRPSNVDSDAPARSAKLLLTTSSSGNCMRLMRCAAKS